MQYISNLYRSHFGYAPAAMQALTAAGSNRLYVRLQDVDGATVIGVHGHDLRENAAFLYWSEHFAACNLPVPRILARSADGQCYLQEDLGELSLAQWVKTHRDESQTEDILRRTLQLLVDFQVCGALEADESKKLPPTAFDARTVLFDLHYFKYCFLRPLDIPFDETALEEDFERLAARLVEIYKEEGETTLLLRDFQSRNVMLRANLSPVFIDYQAARRGPVYFDLASFLYQASARYDEGLRQRLLKAYHERLTALRPHTPAFDVFLRRFQPFILLRTLGVLAAYGLRGLFERKPYFLESIPLALQNLHALIETNLLAPYPALLAAAQAAVSKQDFYLAQVAPSTSATPKSEKTAVSNTLEVTIYSFSYKRGIPDDASGNGGGYVFDCRSTHNPGRYEAYKSLTGRDEAVIRFLEEDGEITTFLQHVTPLVEQHVRRYQERGFTHLQVAFGCTGGQHRSVYSAEHVAAHLRALPNPPHIVLIHREQGIREEY